MKRFTPRYWRLIVIILFLGLAPPGLAFPLDWSFSIFPTPDISGAPGQTVGWGYQINNLDEFDWLVTSFLDAGPFLNATPSVVFDFPILAPLQSVTVPYNGALFQGLYEVALDPGAPLGFVNSGTFTLTVDFWDGDPFAGGQLLSPGWVLEAPYSVTVSTVPEPSGMSYFFAGLVVAGVFIGCSQIRRLRICDK